METRTVTQGECITDDVGLDVCIDCRMQNGERHQEGCSKLDEPPVTDELDRLSEASGCSVEEFVEWLQNESDYVVAKYIIPDDSVFDKEKMVPAGMTNNQLLYEFYGVCEDQVEIERRALLEYQRMIA